METPEPDLTEPHHSTWLSRDDRIRVQNMRDLGYSQHRIAEILNITRDQVQYAIYNPFTPRKPPGRPSQLSPEKVDEIIDFVTYSKYNRQLSYSRLVKALDLEVSAHCLQVALRKRGYRRYPAFKKPPLSERTRELRLAWAQEHIHWSLDQWNKILWTDETWVNDQNHKKVYVTRKAGEELEPTCLVERQQRGKGWMFWGSIHEGKKGPCLFWEKDWGSINKDSYCERIVPLIHGWIRLNPELILMQDGAPGHSAQGIKRELEERGIIVMEWPPFSPDLNPIENIWDKMKDWLQDHYILHSLSYDGLREAVQAAWNQISEEIIQDLISSMPARCQAVIDANGGHTKY